MKTVQEKLAPRTRTDREIPFNSPAIGRKKSQTPKPDPDEAALVEVLHDGFLCGSSHPAGSRCVLLDKEVNGYRLVLIRERQSPVAELSLSPREKQIARMIAKGYPNKAIAGELDISCWTVGTHLRRIFAKLGVTCRAAMVAKLMDMGLSHLVE